MQQTSGLERVYELGHRLKANIARVVVGKDAAVDLTLAALLCRGHILIEDVPGIGKTTLARTLAQSLRCTFGRLQCTPDLMPSDILGLYYFNQKVGEFQFRPGPILVQVLLVDEINRAMPRTQSALLEAMQEQQITVEGVTMRLPSPFLVVATQNPVELEGTFPLPEAQLDRFMLRVRLGYPSAEEESAILLRFGDANPPVGVEPVVAPEELLEMQHTVAKVVVDESVRRYVIQVAQATRQHPMVDLGASPRASLSLYKVSQAHAALQGRDYVLPDDVKAMAEPVLAHRLMLGAQGRLRGGTGEQVVKEVLTGVPVPIYET
ncbi:MAG: MoxR family ATPase [Dehalococcoidia bacterium]|nr:MoxR family ATPase [Dehalococcoidia bacterium]